LITVQLKFKKILDNIVHIVYTISRMRVVRIRWQGNSAVISIPKEFLSHLRAKIGDYVILTAENNGVLIQTLTLEDLKTLKELRSVRK